MGIAFRDLTPGSRYAPPVLRAIAADIKLAHSVFALPFAVVGMLWAARDRGRAPDAIEVGLILACMVAARTFAMATNRAADAGIDAANPRTAGRAVPAGRVSRRAMATTAVLAAVLTAVFAGGFWLWRNNPWPLLLSPLVLAVLGGYSFTKRFTWACHGVLGVALGLSVPAAVVALHPASLSAPGPWLLALFVAAWVAGFDILYALADAAFDRAHGLTSIPARFGRPNAIWFSRTLHLLSVHALIALLLFGPGLGWPAALAVQVAGAALVVEHWQVARSGQLEPRWFLINGFIAIAVGLGFGAALLMT